MELTGAIMKIPTLNGDNYDTWKVRIQTVLVKSKLWDYVSGRIPKPVPKTPGSPTPEEVKLIADCDYEDVKARADLFTSINDTQLKAVKKCNSSQEIWLKLENEYKSKASAREASLWRELLALKMSDNVYVKGRVDNFFDLVRKLEELTIKIGDKLQSLMLLQSLPKSFDNFICAIEARDNLPSPEALKTKICDKARSRRESRSKANAMVARKTDQKSKKAGRGKRSSGRVQSSTKLSSTSVCYGRNKSGHFISNCPDRNIKNEANVVESHISMHTCHAAGETSDTSPHKLWCINSGCITHLCKDKELFEDLVPNDSEVSLANDASAKAMVKDTVAVKASTGKSIRFRNTLYVPELRNNLLSVSKMTDAGNTVKFHSTHVIVKGAKNEEVWFSADRVGDLYYLNLDMAHQAQAVSNEKNSTT